MRLTLFCLACLCLWLRGTDGIMTSGSKDDAKYIVATKDFPFFVSITGRGSCAGTIVSKRHVVTAAHCICSDEGDTNSVSTMVTTLSDGSTVTPVKSHENPNCKFSCEDDGPNKCDVMVLEFNKDIVADSVPVPVYTWDDEVGKELIIFGFGNTGDASDGECVEGDGTFRRAKNVVTAVTGSTNQGGVIKYVMDDAGGLSLEGIAQAGDSGGPAMIERDGKMYLAGANSGTDESNPCRYGAVDQFCRLSSHGDFLSQFAVKADGTTPIPAPTPAPTPAPVSTANKAQSAVSLEITAVITMFLMASGF